MSLRIPGLRKQTISGTSGRKSFLLFNSVDNIHLFRQFHLYEVLDALLMAL